MGKHTSENSNNLKISHDVGCKSSHLVSCDTDLSERKKTYITIATALITYVIALCSQSAGIVRIILFLIPFFICGYEVLVETGEKIIHGNLLDESFLMSVSSICAFILQKYPEAVAIMLFYRIGELLEDFAENKSRNKIAELSELRPDIAILETTDGCLKIHPSEIEIGSIIIINPGERIPLDGVIIEGESSVNLSSLTGESTPVYVRIGDKVYSGAVNISSPVRVKVECDYYESTASRILKLVEDAADRKSKQETLIHRFAKFYTPAVVALSVIIAVVPSIITGDWKTWINKAIMLLVVSCPCAFVISVPLTYFAGLGNAAQNGILVKGSNYLESLAKAKIYVFDKTGTVTEGVFKLEKVIPEGISEEVLIAFTAAAEQYSSHPLAHAIKNAADSEVLSDCTITDYVETPGRGVSANVNGAIVCAGNADYISEKCSLFNPPKTEGTSVYVSINSKYRGCILLADKIKPGVFDALEELRFNGASKLVMLTGDINSISRKVAKSLNFDMLKAELLPEDKVSTVEYLIQNANKDEKVAFIGDGTNDAPVIARADIGIAMGCFGSNSAIEAADIVIMDDDITQIVKAAKISSFTLKVAKQNIIISIGAKLLIIILSILGISGMWIAVIGDVGVLLVAILNSLRALTKKY